MTKELEQSIVGQASEVLKTHMQIKQEQGSSEVVASDVGASASGNIASSNLSEHIDLDSPPHTSHYKKACLIAAVFNLRESFCGIFQNPRLY